MVAAVIYAPGVTAPFYLDDFIVVNNSESFQKTRFLGYFSFWLSNRLETLLGLVFPWDVTIYFRIPNIAIHVLAAVVVYWLAWELIGRRLPAGIAGALFLVHPIQTQAVTYVSQRFESQAALFMFLAGVTYVRFRKGGSRYWLVGTLLAAIAAATTKENAVALPLWLMLMEVVFFSGIRSLKKIAYFVPLVVVVAFPTVKTFLDSGATLLWIPFELYLLSQASVLLTYLRLIFFPGKQFLLYDFPPVTVVTSVVVMEWMVVLGIIGLGIYLARKKPLVGFGILTFFVMLSPTSVMPLPDLIFEHRIYPAFAGIAIAAASVFKPNRKMLAVFCIIFAFLGYKTVKRNRQWKNRLEFLELSRTEFPHEARVLGSLATAYAMRGEINKAILLNQEARQYLPELNAFYRKSGILIIDFNLATLYMESGNLPKALEEAQRVLSVDPEQVGAYKIAASVKFQSGDFVGARTILQRALLVAPGDRALWNSMKMVEESLGDTAKSRDAAAKVVELDPLKGVVPSKPPDPGFGVLHHTNILFGFLFSFLVGGFLVVSYVLPQTKEIWFWLRTGRLPDVSTISVDDAAAGLQGK